ncbi:PIN domain-like protein, partial [Dichotomocladium elegans]
MGIYGLATFVQEHCSLGEKESWHVDATEKRTSFVIDGNAFTYHYAMQSRTSWAHGGQYSAIARTIRHDLLILQRAGIELTFVFDGAVPQDKQKTRLHRYATYIERGATTLSNLDNINASLRRSASNEPQIPNELFLLPPLMLDVCIQTLREMGIRVIICTGEADGHVVNMAHNQDGYVLSKDSDMHVYPHSGKGYIPLNTLSISNDAVTATVYHPRALASLLNLDVALLPLFGTLLGNDYLDAKLVRMPIIEWCSERGFQCRSKTAFWPKFVAEFLHK